MFFYGSGMVRKAGKVFYGWWMVAAGSVLCMFGYGSYFYSYGALFNPISHEFGWSRATTSVAFSLSRLEGGIQGLITGPLTDKYGPRAMVIAGWMMAAIGFVLMYYMHSFWMFILSYTVFVSLGMGTGLYLPLQTAVARWFSEKRGLAMGILTAGAALGGSAIVPGVAWLITNYGWRVSVLVLTAATAVLGLGLGAVLKPHGPERYGLAPDGKKHPPAEAASSSRQEGKQPHADAGEGLTLKEAMNTRAFWLMVLAFTFSHTALSAIVVHQIPFLEDMGISKVLAATALGMMTLISVPGRISGGWLADKVDVRRLYFASSLVQALGLFFLAKATNMAWIWAFVIVYGTGMGLRLPLEPMLRAQFFGYKAFGAIMGYINAFAVFGSFAGPYFAGWIFDTTGSYITAFLTFAAMMVMAAVVILVLKPPVKQDKAGATGAAH